MVEERIKKKTLKWVEKVIVTTTRKNIFNKHLRNDSEVEFETCGCFGFLIVDQNERINLGLGFAICWKVVKGCEVCVFTLVQKFKILTQVRQRELDGSSEKVEMGNGINTFRYL